MPHQTEHMPIICWINNKGDRLNSKLLINIIAVRTETNPKKITPLPARGPVMGDSLQEDEDPSENVAMTDVPHSVSKYEVPGSEIVNSHLFSLRLYKNYHTYF